MPVPFLAPLIAAGGSAGAAAGLAAGGGGLLSTLGSIGGLLDGLGSVGGLFGGLFGGSREDAEREKATQLEQIQNTIRAQGANAALRADQARKIQEQRLARVGEQYDRAEAQVRGSGGQARRDVGLVGRQAQSRVAANASSRGFDGSSVERNASRAVASDIGRVMGSVSTGVGNALAGLGTQRAGIESGIRADMAQIPWQQALLEQSASRDMASLLSSIQHTSSGPGLGSIAGIGGLLSGFGDALGAGGGVQGIVSNWSNLFG